MNTLEKLSTLLEFVKDMALLHLSDQELLDREKDTEFTWDYSQKIIRKERAECARYCRKILKEIGEIE